MKHEEISADPAKAIKISEDFLEVSGYSGKHDEKGYYLKDNQNADESSPTDGS